MPIAPAAHYLSGGVLTDLSGATGLPRLWAAGEVACTGVHGANRLASNSLLEGMVFGARLAESILGGVGGPAPTGAMRALGDEVDGESPAVRVGSDGRVVAGGPGTFPAGPAFPEGPTSPAGPRHAGVEVSSDQSKARDLLQRTMTEGAGVVRSADSLTRAKRVIDIIGESHGSEADRAGRELANLVTVATGLLVSAALRTETRGAHARSDHPEPDERWRRRVVHVGAGLAFDRHGKRGGRS